LEKCADLHSSDRDQLCSLPSQVFKILPHMVDELLVVLALSAIVFIAVEIEKFFSQK
jgi:uncharacterized membrane protein SirB2